METLKYKPDFIYRRNKPVAVVLKISDYQKILEELEDAEDVKYLKEIRENGFKTTDFDDYLASRGLGV